jgi:hypothetical protein
MSSDFAAPDASIDETAGNDSAAPMRISFASRIAREYLIIFRIMKDWAQEPRVIVKASPATKGPSVRVTPGFVRTAAT